MEKQLAHRLIGLRLTDIRDENLTIYSHNDQHFIYTAAYHTAQKPQEDYCTHTDIAGTILLLIIPNY